MFIELIDLIRNFLDCDDLDAIVMGQKSMVEFFEKFGFSKNQLLKLLREVAGGDNVVRMGTNPTEQVITTAILNHTSNATTNQRVSRPGGVDAKEGGAVGGTCSSPGGRSSVAVGQQRESLAVQVSSSDQQIN